MEQENVPSDKKYMISTRNNSTHKWKAKHVVGALEVPSEPDLHLRLPYTEHAVDADKFREFMRIWDHYKLRVSFIQACENLPKETCCCGLMTDNDETIKSMVPALNEGFFKRTNEKLARKGKHIRLDAFLWKWHNATGKAETNILLIRFFETPEGTSTTSSK